jgi:O-antigen/teichoic acid export membrane protein
MKLRTEISTAAELVAGAAFSAALIFVYVALAARRLGPVAYADFSSALTFIYVATVACSAISPAVSRVVARLVERGEIEGVDALRASVRRRFMRWSILALVVSFAAAVPLARLFHFQSAMTVLLALTCAIAFVLVSAERGFLHGLGRFRTHNVNVIFESALRLALAGAFLAVSQRPEAALVPYLLSPVAALAILIVRERTPTGTAEEDGWPEIVRLAAPILLLMLGAAVYQNADMLAVKRWLPAAVAGQYGAAFALVRGFGVLFVPLYIMSGPLLISLHEQGRSIVGATLRLSGYFVALSAVPLAALMWYGREITVLVYGRAYAEAGSISGPLAGVVMLGYLTLLIAQARVTVGAFGVARVYAVFALVQVVVLLFVHDSVTSIIAVLYAVSCAMLIVVIAALFRPLK